jgi:uncharacterized protein (DUF1697 family)
MSFLRMTEVPEPGDPTGKIVKSSLSPGTDSALELGSSLRAQRLFKEGYTMRYACLLRGVNVAGQRKISMRELCEAVQAAGFSKVTSYLQSGNLILESDMSIEATGRRLEKTISDKLHYDDVDVLVLDLKALKRIIAARPEDPHLAGPVPWYFTFLATTPANEHWKTLEGSEYSPDRYFPGGGVIYVYCPTGYGRTKINNAFFERKLKVRATTRNWNTVTKLAEMLAE